MAHPPQWEMAVFQVGVPEYLEAAVAGIVNFLPQLIGALVILAIGWIIGRVVGAAVRRITDRTNVDRLVMDTALGRALGGSENAVSRSFGRIVSYFVYALAILAAADALAIELLSEWITAAVTYLPAFLAGAAIIILGFILADFLADVVGSTQTLTEVRYTEFAADGLRVFLYFVAVVAGLDTMGVDVQILYLFAAALAGGLGLGAALAIGISFGFGGRDYVAANIDDWLARGPPDREQRPMGQADGGEETTD